MALKNPDDESYDPWERGFQGSISIWPLLKGINDYETAMKAHRMAHEYDAPAEQKKYIAKKLASYRD